MQHKTKHQHELGLIRQPLGIPALKISASPPENDKIIILSSTLPYRQEHFYRRAYQLTIIKTSWNCAFSRRNAVQKHLKRGFHPSPQWDFFVCVSAPPHKNHRWRMCVYRTPWKLPCITKNCCSTGCDLYLPRMRDSPVSAHSWELRASKLELSNSFIAACQTQHRSVREVC